MNTLTPKQTAFADEYMQDLNATQAAIRAGYSMKTAYSQGQRLLKNVEVKTAINQRLTVASDRADISTEWILERLQHEAMNADSDGARVRALELLGKYRSMFYEKDNDKGPTHEEVLDELDAYIEAQKNLPLLEHDE